MRPGRIPPLDEARAASKAVADQALRDEIEFLHGEVRDLIARNLRLSTALAKVASEHANCARDRESWELDRKLRNRVTGLSVVEPDDDELAASIARHPAGKQRGSHA